MRSTAASASARSGWDSRPGLEGLLDVHLPLSAAIPAGAPHGIDQRLHFAFQPLQISFGDLLRALHFLLPALQFDHQAHALMDQRSDRGYFSVVLAEVLFGRHDAFIMPYCGLCGNGECWLN